MPSTRKEHLLTTDNSQTEAKSQASSLLSLSDNSFPGCALLASGHALTEAIHIGADLAKPCLSCSLCGSQCPRFAGAYQGLAGPDPAGPAGPGTGAVAAAASPDRLMSNTVALHPVFSATTTGETPGDNATTVAKIVGYRKLQQLLAPEHPYFIDKKAHIVQFAQYCRKEDEQDEQAPLFLYPVVKGDNKLAHKLNPYRKYRLARSHTGRLVSEIENCFNSNGLQDGRIAEIIQTIPADVSLALSELDNGKDLMWKAYKKFWDNLPDILGIDGFLGTETNLHTWKTEEPLKPHYHFHSLTFNYFVKYLPEKMNQKLQVERSGQFEPEFRKWFGDGILKQRVNDDDLVQNGYFPFSSDEMSAMKRLWTEIIRKMSLKNHIECAYFGNSEALLDVNVSFFSLDDRTRLASRLNYQRRHWIEDYTLYTLKQPDCEDPPAWLETYNNRARCFGWWLWLSLLGGIECQDVTPKRDYETGAELVEHGQCTSFLNLELWSLETIKGRAVNSRLNNADIEWLKTVYWTGFDGGG